MGKNSVRLPSPLPAKTLRRPISRRGPQIIVCIEEEFVNAGFMLCDRLTLLYFRALFTVDGPPPNLPIAARAEDRHGICKCRVCRRVHNQVLDRSCVAFESVEFRSTTDIPDDDARVGASGDKKGLVIEQYTDDRLDEVRMANVFVQQLPG